jgi:hypothetical protein
MSVRWQFAIVAALAVCLVWPSTVQAQPHEEFAARRPATQQSDLLRRLPSTTQRDIPGRPPDRARADRFDQRAALHTLVEPAPLQAVPTGETARVQYLYEQEVGFGWGAQGYPTTQHPYSILDSPAPPTLPPPAAHPMPPTVPVATEMPLIYPETCAPVPCAPVAPEAVLPTAAPPDPAAPFSLRLSTGRIWYFPAGRR